MHKRKPVVLDGNKSVMVPPQAEHLVDIQYSSTPTATKPIWGWIVVVGLVVIAIIFFVIYG
ncbi:MAG: hypothetical protein PHR51_01615 [Patescibacteria group bacterium]|nr:hypothetical protein [Patescibacteria group bacterium]